MADRVVSYDFRGKFTNLTAGLAAAGKSVDDFGHKLTAADKNGAKMRAGLTTVGATAGKVGLVAAAGLGAVVLSAAKFDKAMSAVQAATHETAGNMEQLRAAAIKAGADTVYSAGEAAGAIEELAKAGVSTRDILGGGLDGALSLAAAGSLDVADAAQIAATALTQFKLGGEDVGHVADLLAAGAGKAQGDVSDLGMALKQGGLVAAQTGLTIEETTGTLAAFASAGLIGSDAGTSFKTMLQSLTPSSVKAGETMDALGISAYDAQGNFVGMTKFAASLQQGLKGLSVEQQNAAMKTIFGSDAVRAASVIFQEGAGGIQSWIDKTNDSGYAAETAATRLDNLSGDLEQFKGSLETALIGAGEGSQGPLRKLVQGATSAVNAFNDLPPAMQGTATGLLAITAITGGGLWFASKAINGVTSMKSALENLGFSSDKSSAALKGVGKAATVASAALAGLAVLDAIQVGAAKSLPGVQELTGNLLDLANASGDLPKEFDDLGSSIDRLANPNRAQALQDNISDAIGGIGGGSELKDARAEIESLDAALTNLVTSAGPEVARAAFQKIALSAGLSTDEIANLTSLLPAYKDALAGAATQADLAAAATTQHASASENDAKAQRDEAKALNDSVKAMRDKRDAALGAFDAETQYRQAMKDATAQANKNSAGIRGNSDAALANRASLSQLAGAWNNQSDAVKNNVAKFKEARGNFIETATAMGVPREAARLLAKQLLDIPRSRVVKVTAETSAAMAALNGIQNFKLRDKYITVHTRNTGDNYTGSAAGGTVPKTGLGYADRHPYLLADGEEVISNRYGQADKNRAALKAANAGAKLTVIGGLAAGGTAGPNVPTFMGWGPTVDSNGKTLDAALRYFETHLKDAGKGLERLGNHLVRELTARQTLLKDELDHEKQRLQMLKQERDAIAQQVSSAFHTDVFGGSSSIDWSATGLSPAAVAQMQTTQQHNALTSGIAEKQEALRLLKILRQHGLNGQAFINLAATGDVDTLRAYAEMSKSDLAQYERLYNQDARLEKRLGGYVGNAEMGHAIAAQAKDVHETRQELHHVNRQLAAVTKELQQIKKIEANQAKEHAKHTGAAINGAATTGQKRRVRR